jgi:sigma-E factor negative regulatory protein RseC
MWRLDRRGEKLVVPAVGELKPGDRVLVALPERYVLRGALLLHGVPLAALLFGALAGSALGGSDVAAVVGAVLGVAVALAATPRLRARLERAVTRSLDVRPVRAAGEVSERD